MSADVGSVVNITNTQFSVCSAIIGGAVQSAGTVTLVDTILDSNTAEQSGGALHSTATGVISAAKCTFTNNQVHSRNTVLVADIIMSMLLPLACF
jgi:predicted outer membrane repeat protein